MITTWKCHICKEERPDSAISVLQKDTSADYGFPVGTIQQNVRYCNDMRTCISGASEFRFDAARSGSEDGGGDE